MTREAVIDKLRDIIIEDFQSLYDDYGGQKYLDRIKTAKTLQNIRQLADLCQSSAWDIQQFCNALIQALEFPSEDSFECYGWDT